MSIIGTGTITVYDLNDATLSENAPRNPEPGTLWIDTSGPKNILKKWDGNRWVEAKLDVEKLDEDLAEKIDTLSGRLGAIAEEGILDYNGRLTIAEEIGRIIGEPPSSTKVNHRVSLLPSVHTLDASGGGSFASYRARARLVGVDTNETAYSNLEVAYRELADHLATYTPRPWDITLENKDKVPEIEDPDLFRKRFLDYYNAELALSVLTEELAQKKVEEGLQDNRDFTEEYTDKSTSETADAIELADSVGDKHYTVPHEQSLLKWTIEALVFLSPKENEGKSPISHSTNFDMYVDLDDDDYFVYGNTLGDLKSNDPIPRNKWVRISVTYENLNTNIYVDGELVGSGRAIGTFLLNSLAIGSGSDGSTFKGYIANFRVFDAVLSEQEINENLLTMINPEHPNLVVNYKMNGGHKLYDSSPNGYHIELDPKKSRWVDSSTALKDIQNTVESDMNDLEDEVDNLINTVTADIENLGDSIRQTVSDLTTEVEGALVELESSILTQTADKYDIQFNTMRRDTDRNSEDLNEFKSVFSFSQDGTFTIGNSGSNYKMVLSNEKLSFMDGRTEVAYISNSTMQITRGIFVENLTIGAHKFTSLDSSFTVVEWVPNAVRN